MRRMAWLLIVLADLGILVWGAAAAVAPDRLLGPGGRPILAAGYEGFTGGSWAAFVATSPAAGNFMTVLFRVYGAYNVAFGLLGAVMAATTFRRGDRWAWWALLVGNTVAYGAAMTYDRTVHAIGPFEAFEYLGLAAVWAALLIARPRPNRADLR